jgi:hypothetical protein
VGSANDPLRMLDDVTAYDYIIGLVDVVVIDDVIFSHV